MRRGELYLQVLPKTAIEEKGREAAVCMSVNAGDISHMEGQMEWIIEAIQKTYLLDLTGEWWTERLKLFLFSNQLGFRCKDFWQYCERKK